MQQVTCSLLSRVFMATQEAVEDVSMTLADTSLQSSCIEGEAHDSNTLPVKRGPATGVVHLDKFQGSGSRGLKCILLGVLFQNNNNTRTRARVRACRAGRARTRA